MRESPSRNLIYQLRHSMGYKKWHSPVGIVAHITTLLPDAHSVQHREDLSEPHVEFIVNKKLPKREIARIEDAAGLDLRLVGSRTVKGKKQYGYLFEGNPGQWGHFY